MKNIFIFALAMFSVSSYGMDARVTEYIQEQSALFPERGAALQIVSIAYRLECGKQLSVATLRDLKSSSSFKEIVRSASNTPIGVNRVRAVFKKNDEPICEV